MSQIESGLRLAQQARGDTADMSNAANNGGSSTENSDGRGTTENDGNEDATSTTATTKTTASAGSDVAIGKATSIVTVDIKPSPSVFLVQSQNNLTVSYSSDEDDVTFETLMWIDDIKKVTIGSVSIDDKESSDSIVDVTESSAVLQLGALESNQYSDLMRVQISWSMDGKKGNTSSSYFAALMQEDAAASAAASSSIVAADATAVLETTSAVPTVTQSNASDGDISQSTGSSKSGNDGGGGGSKGLSPGAIAGVVIGVVGGLLLIAALAFFLLRKRRKNKKLSDGYTGTDSANTYMVDKETHGRTTDSPNSPYSDDNQDRSLPMENVSRDETATAPVAMGGIPRTSTGGSHSARAETPQGVSSNVAHLVEEGMTMDEIRRLEEEERQLDDEIERAARR